MTLARVASLVGVSLLVMVLNIAFSIVYMIVYSHVINRGHPAEYYQEHVKVAAPYCSIVAGIPLMFLAGLWAAGWSDRDHPHGVWAALVIGLTYAIVDLAILLASGMTTKIALLFLISILTKLAAACGGAMVATHAMAQRAGGAGA